MATMSIIWFGWEIFFLLHTVIRRPDNLLIKLYACWSSADNLGKQLAPRLGPTKHHAWSQPKLFDTDSIPEIFFEKLFKINCEKKSQLREKDILKCVR